MSNEPEWIRTTDREPKDGQRVIAYLANEKGRTVVDVCGAVYYAKRRWFAAHGQAFKASHWMPMPKPPRVGVTVVELMVVLAIIATLLGLLGSAAVGWRDPKEGGPPESWSISTVQHDGHWWIVGNRWGEHHPDCPCGRKAEAE